MKISKKLATFLAEEGVLTKFIANHEKFFTYGHMPENTDIIDTITECGFNWLKSPEGYTYWLKLSNKFNTYRENN